MGAADGVPGGTRLPGPTPEQTIGPFFGFALPFGDGPYLLPDVGAGALRVGGRVLDGAGQPVPDALIEIAQAAPADRAADAGTFRRFGRCPTGGSGEFFFVTAKPAADPPDAPHLNLMIFARGLLRHLVTRVYFPDEAAANAADPVLAAIPDPRRRATLVGRSSRPGGLTFDIRLQGEHETVFFGV